MHRITEIFDTHYFYATWNRDLDIFIKSLSQEKKTNTLVTTQHYLPSVDKALADALANNDYTIDIAGACLTKDNMILLRNAIAYDDLIVTDTLNAKRRELLENIVNNVHKDYKTVALPTPHLSSENDIIEYIKQLDKETIYSLNTGSKEQWYIPVAVIISIMRPAIQLDLGVHATEFFSYVNASLHELPTADAYYVINESNYYYTAKVDSEGLIYVPGIGSRVPKEIRERYIVIPADFGRRSKRQDPTYVDLLRRAIADVKVWLSKHKTMLAYFGKGGILC